MRRRDKSKNIERANLLAEQRYLESKGLLKESYACDEGTINESGMAHAAGFAEGGSGFEEGATMMQDNVDVLKEGSDTYFETLSATLDHVREMAKEMGYELDEDDVNFQFGTGGIPYGQTKSATIPLLKDGEPIMGKSGKPLNRAIRVSIYRMDSGRYELTAYKTF